MKKIILIICLFLPQVTTQGQAILNADFENWANSSYDDLIDWSTSNYDAMHSYSVQNVAQFQGISGLSAILSTQVPGLDTLLGYVTNTLGDPLAGEGGVPYSDQPTELTGYYAYNLNGSDSAIILVIFKNGGAIISTDIFMIAGSEPNLIPFSLPLSLTSAPDTVIIAVASSNAISNMGVTNGSWIQVDEFAFTGPSVTQPIPGGTFDNWAGYTIDDPFDWYTVGNGVHQSTDAYSGLSALSLVSLSDGSSVQMSAATSGQSFYEGGQPFTNMVDSLVGYYKYLSPGADTGLGVITTTLNTTSVGGGIAYFLPTGVYTRFSIPIASSMNPDSMRIDFYSSYPFTTAVDGSTLYIDNLELQSIITGVDKNQQKNSNLFSTYPNPVNDKLHVTYAGNVNDLQSFLYNSIGELIYESNSSKNSFEMEMGNIPAGYYWLKLVSGTNVSVRKIIKQ